MSETNENAKESLNLLAGKNEITSILSMESKEEHQTELDSIPGREWIDKLKYAFREADIHKNNRISRRLWINSRLRFVISDKPLTDGEMDDFFNKVDTDLDGFIQFEELENYLIAHQGSVSEAVINKVVQLSYSKPFDESVSFTKPTERVLQALFLPKTVQFLSLTESTFTIWDATTLQPVQQFKSFIQEKFVAFCFISALDLSAIATQQRKIIFIDMRKLEKLSFFISASYDARHIMKMNLNESFEALRHVEKNQVPLFNSPTSIAAHPKLSIFFIGDDSGQIEVFQLIKPKTKGSYNYSRLAAEKLHQSHVSQITYIDEFEVFISSSFDGSFQMWTYDVRFKKFKIQYTFHEPLKYSIVSFIYDKRTRDIVYNTTNHYLFSWRIRTNHRTSVAVPETVTALSIYQPDDKASYLITVSSNRFFTTYQMPNFDQSRNWFMGMHHDLSAPGAMLVIDDDLYLFGSYVSAWKIEITEEQQQTGNVGPLLVALWSEESQRILTIDQRGNQIQWDGTTGIKQYKSLLTISDNISVRCACMDKPKRKLGVGFSNGCFQIISVNSGTILFDIDNTYCPNGCNTIEIGVLFGVERVVCSSNKRSAVIFDIVAGKRLQFLRNFVGHTENIMKTVILKEKLILTIGTEVECFLWSLSQQAPIMKFTFRDEPTTATDIPFDPNIFIVGDISGYIYFISIDTYEILFQMKPFNMAKSTSITCLKVIEELGILIASNFNGYVQVWGIDNTDSFIADRLQEKKLFRAHTQSIFSIEYSKSLNCIITLGRDQEVRLWSLAHSLVLIGEIGKTIKWNINDPQTWDNSESICFNEDDFLKNEVEDKMQARAARSILTSNAGSKGTVDQVEPEFVSTFTLSSFEAMMNQMEDQVESGKNLIKSLTPKTEDEIAERNKLRPPPRPPPKNFRFDALVSNQELMKVQRDMNKIHGVPSKKVQDKPRKTYQKW